MITSSKEADVPTKQEGNTSDGRTTAKASSSSTPWLRLKDPRIVRVSRAFGGKDRHSKVCTIRGLRDRRVRLSVSTAIQLYDLQDRLGFNQPSKVVDWLLNAAKNEIDELPPLPILPGNFGLSHQEMLSSSHEVSASHSNKDGFKLNNSFEWEPRQNFWSSDSLFRSKLKEVARDSVSEREDKQDSNQGRHGAQVSSSSFLPRSASHSSPPGLINNAIPYGSFFQLEPPSFPLSQLGSHGFENQTEGQHNLNVMPLPSTLSLSSGSQILVCPPPGATQSYFPSHVTANSVEIDPRQINHFQMLTSNTQNLLSNSLTPSPYSVSQSMKPFHFSVTPSPRFLHSQNSGRQQDKGGEFPSK